MSISFGGGSTQPESEFISSVQMLHSYAGLSRTELSSKQEQVSRCIHSILVEVEQGHAQNMPQELVHSLESDISLLNTSLKLLFSPETQGIQESNILLERLQDINPLPKNFEEIIDEHPEAVGELWAKGHVQRKQEGGETTLVFSKQLTDLLHPQLVEKILLNPVTFVTCINQENGLHFLQGLAIKFSDERSIERIVNLMIFSLQALSGERREIIARICARMQQFVSLAPPCHNLTPLEMLRTAVFLELELPKLVEAGNFYFRKRVHGLPRTVVAHPDAILLLSKKKVKILQKAGGYNRVMTAICMPPLQFSNEALVVAQSITKGTLSPSALRGEKRAKAIHQMLSGMPGIWPLHLWFRYETGKGIEKASSISPLAEGDLSKAKGRASFEEVVYIASRTVQGLFSMHSKGIVHGDLKLLNVLFLKHIIGISDFGMAFNPQTDPPPFIYDNGSYGTMTYTAPELFGCPQFRGDYQKTDVWALGMMLYQLYFKRAAPWESLLLQHSQGLEVSHDAKMAMLRSIDQHIERPLRALLRKGNLTKQEAFACFIYQLMRKDPNQRLDAQAALQLMNQI